MFFFYLKYFTKAPQSHAFFAGKTVIAAREVLSVFLALPIPSAFISPGIYDIFANYKNIRTLLSRAEPNEDQMLNIFF